MRAEQTVSEMVVEVLGRQADKLAYRSDQPIQEALEQVLKTEAGQQLAELAEGSHRHEKAIYWQANLLFERASEQAGHPVSRRRDRRF
jgi:hypothetical protein